VRWPSSDELFEVEQIGPARPSGGRVRIAIWQLEPVAHVFAHTLRGCESSPSRFVVCIKLFERGAIVAMAGWLTNEALC
jgi:hypothetical protein